MAAYLRELRILGEVALEDVRSAAPLVLDLLAQGISKEEIPDRHAGLTSGVINASIMYAVSLLLENRYSPLVEPSPHEGVLGRRLSEQDQDLLDDYCRSRGVPTIGLELERWSRFVEEVEQRYEDIIEEYEYALWNREQLEDQLLLVSPSGQEHLRLEVLPWDKRFEQATRQLHDPPMVRAGRWEGKHWQWYRVPLHCGERFASDLVEMGIADPVERGDSS